MAYKEQGTSLVKVQKFGPSLERDVVAALGWKSDRLVYFEDPNNDITYDLQVDGYLGEKNNPLAFVSVTYCNPDKPGHSNENKLQLKLGELMLLKSKYPNVRSMLVIGGTENAWLRYVLQAFKFFFDKTLFTWNENFSEEILKIKSDYRHIPTQHSEVWNSISKDWATTKLWDQEPIRSELRLGIWHEVQEQGVFENPEEIPNSIFRLCMKTAYETSVHTRNRNGKEWSNYLHEDWDALWQSRSFFNPAEAAIYLTLKNAGFAFAGGLAKDEEVPSLIHHLGGNDVDNTKVSEDFILYSKKYSCPVFIQSKSTGGGMEGHGKNIQNRTKEQIARSLFYRGYIEKNEVKLRKKDFIWIGVIDGNWGVTKKTPLKYIHMLQWAGYDYLIGADSLANEHFDLIQNAKNPLTDVINDLECEKSIDAFNTLWIEWKSSRLLK